MCVCVCVQVGGGGEESDGWSDEETAEAAPQEVGADALIGHTMGNLRSAMDNISTDSKVNAAARRCEYGSQADGSVGRF